MTSGLHEVFAPVPRGGQPRNTLRSHRSSGQRWESGRAVPRPGAATVSAEKGREQEASATCSRPLRIPPPPSLAQHQPSGLSCALLLPPEQGLEMKQTQMTSRHRQRSPASCRTAEYSLYCFS